MLPTLEAAEICVAVPVALCLLAPIGCLAGALFLGGLAMAPVACVLCPLLCCTACATCCCCAPSAGDESGPGLYVDRQPVFFTPYGAAVFTRTGLYDDGEVYIVNSTVFTDAAPPPRGAARRTGAGGVVITELPDDAPAGAVAGKDKAA